MTLTEIKKELYKQKPKAEFVSANKSGLLYAARIGSDPEGYNEYAHFKIPFSDIGDASFLEKMQSQLLIRWLLPKGQPVNPPTQLSENQ